MGHENSYLMIQPKIRGGRRSISWSRTRYYTFTSSTRRRTTTTIILLVILLVTHLVATVRGSSSSSSSTGRGGRSISSTLLKLQRIYAREHPHDDSLYRILGVSTNATHYQIQKAYRSKSRKWHPDKIQNKNNAAEAQERFREIQQAYEVLKDDTTRLLYHRFGLFDTSDALTLLSGRTDLLSGNSQQDYRELLRLMGHVVEEANNNNASSFLFGPPPHPGGLPHSSTTARAARIATDLRENYIRPLVEGTVRDADMVDILIDLCDRLKSLPLGSQILRCIGHAYRHSGRKVLKHYYQQQKQLSQPQHPILLFPQKPSDYVSDSILEKVRLVQHVGEAAYHAGKAMLTEQWYKQQDQLFSSSSSNPNKNFLSLDHDTSWIGRLPGEEDISDDDVLTNVVDPSEEELQERERQRVNQAILESLQVAAYWKVSKIDLDRTIREACDLILSPKQQHLRQGQFFFVDSSAFDGWVTDGDNRSMNDLSDNIEDKSSDDDGDGEEPSTVPRRQRGVVMDAEVGRLRSAAALVMIGDIFVERSKTKRRKK